MCRWSLDTRVKGVEKSEILISKSQENSKFECSNFRKVRGRLPRRCAPRNDSFVKREGCLGVEIAASLALTGQAPRNDRYPISF